jgi:hypothetical protein
VYRGMEFGGRAYLDCGLPGRGGFILISDAWQMARVRPVQERMPITWGYGHLPDSTVMLADGDSRMDGVIYVARAPVTMITFAV